jgi:hypothetical protein
MATLHCKVNHKGVLVNMNESSMFIARPDLEGNINLGDAARLDEK